MKIVKQSTATTLLLGPFIDDTDGKTAETALTLSQGDVLLWKEGGTTLAQKNESTSCTHRSNGLYTCPVDTTDTNTLGILTVSVHEAGALPVRHDYFVVPATTYDTWKTNGILSLFTQALTESYAADGAAPTVAQSLFLIQQMLTEFAISGTTLTVKGLDGSTSKAAFTLNSSTAPSSITRAT